MIRIKHLIPLGASGALGASALLTVGCNALLDYGADPSRCEGLSVEECSDLGAVCETTNDGTCDEGIRCDCGSDTRDCESNPPSEGHDYYTQCGNSFDPNSCQRSYNGICDEPYGCEYGTDTYDCAPFYTPEPNSCSSAYNGSCDEPYTCEDGTDTYDCDMATEPNSCSSAYNGSCDEPYTCEDGTDTYDCDNYSETLANACEFSYDGACDDPRDCLSGTDTYDCSVSPLYVVTDINSCEYAYDGFCREDYSACNTLDNQREYEDYGEVYGDYYCTQYFARPCKQGTDAYDCSGLTGTEAPNIGTYCNPYDLVSVCTGGTVCAEDLYACEARCGSFDNFNDGCPEGTYCEYRYVGYDEYEYEEEYVYYCAAYL